MEKTELVGFLDNLWKEIAAQEEAITKSLGKCRRLAEEVYLKLVQEMHGAKPGACVSARVIARFDENNDRVWETFDGVIVGVIRGGSTANKPYMKPTIRVEYFDGNQKQTRLSSEWELLGEKPAGIGCIGNVGVVG